MKTALIGCGLIGGSLALALRSRLGTIVGCDPENAEKARALGIVDEVADVGGAVRDAEVVIIAVPVRQTAAVCEAMAPAVSDSALIMDVGSTKREVLHAVELWLPHPERFVAAHPIAGTERSGPEAADANLFRGRKVLLTPAAATRADCVARAGELWEAAGATVARMDAADHDRVLAWVSHLPHVAAFALAAAVGSDASLEGLSGGGFTDTTRIAASDPRMWRDVLLSNREEVLAAMRGLDEELALLRRAIAGGDGDEIERLIERARDGRKRILRA